MKNIWNKYKWLFLIMINALPYVLEVLSWRAGASFDVLFLLFFPALVYLNYKSCSKVIPYVLLQLFMLVCIVISVSHSTYLYYHYISDDFMTAAIGGLTVYFESFVNIVTTIITAILKAIHNKKLSNNYPQLSPKEER